MDKNILLEFQSLLAIMQRFVIAKVLEALGLDDQSFRDDF